MATDGGEVHPHAKPQPVWHCTMKPIGPCQSNQQQTLSSKSGAKFKIFPAQRPKPPTPAALSLFKMKQAAKTHCAAWSSMRIALAVPGSLLQKNKTPSSWEMKYGGRLVCLTLCEVTICAALIISWSAPYGKHRRKHRSPRAPCAPRSSSAARRRPYPESLSSCHSVRRS